MFGDRQGTHSVTVCDSCTASYVLLAIPSMALACPGLLFCFSSVCAVVAVPTVVGTGLCCCLVLWPLRAEQADIVMLLPLLSSCLCSLRQRCKVPSLTLVHGSTVAWGASWVPPGCLGSASCSAAAQPSIQVLTVRVWPRYSRSWQLRRQQQQVSCCLAGYGDRVASSAGATRLVSITCTGVRGCWAADEVTGCLIGHSRQHSGATHTPSCVLTSSLLCACCASACDPLPDILPLLSRLTPSSCVKA